jgi:hypothetical protein
VQAVISGLIALQSAVIVREYWRGVSLRGYLSDSWNLMEILILVLFIVVVCIDSFVIIRDSEVRRVVCTLSRAVVIALRRAAVSRAVQARLEQHNRVPGHLAARGAPPY